MNTHRVNAAAGVIHAAMQQGRTLPAALAVALECAQLLQSPAPAATVPAPLTEEQVELLADAANRLWADANHDDLCACVDWPERCVNGHYLDEWRSGAVEVGMSAVIGLWESWRAAVESAELARLRARVDEVERMYTFDTAKLRARVDELEAERHSTNEALDDAAQALRRDRDRIAELETDLDARGQDLAAAMAGWGRARDRAAADAPPNHEGPEHHDYRLGRDLPQYPVTPPPADQPALAHQEQQ